MKKFLQISDFNILIKISYSLTHYTPIPVALHCTSNLQVSFKLSHNFKCRLYLECFFQAAALANKKKLHFLIAKKAVHYRRAFIYRKTSLDRKWNRNGKLLQLTCGLVFVIQRTGSVFRNRHYYRFLIPARAGRRCGDRSRCKRAVTGRDRRQVVFAFAGGGLPHSPGLRVGLRTYYPPFYLTLTYPLFTPTPFQSEGSFLHQSPLLTWLTTRQVPTYIYIYSDKASTFIDVFTSFDT